MEKDYQTTVLSPTKIIAIEGLKGSGKNRVLELIKLRYGMELITKFTKGKTNLVDFAVEFKEQYQSKFKNIESSFGLQYYSNFFNYLKHETMSRPAVIVCNRGMLSLPYFGYYGYFHNEENYPFDSYEVLQAELFRTALSKYAALSLDNYLLTLECSKQETFRRIKSRPRVILADRFFIEKFSLYQQAKHRLEIIACEMLPKSNFLFFNNEIPTDLEPILEVLGKIIEK